MHRSGTSSVAGALVSLGGAAPLHLLPPLPDNNEKGFWESSVLMELNDEILHRRRKPLEATGGLSISGESTLKPRLRCKPARRAALMSESGVADLPILKDPRMCRLMRFWAPVFEEAGGPSAPFCHSDRRLRSPGRFIAVTAISVSWGCLLWLRHVLDAEAETRAIPRAVLDWTRFLGDRRGALRGSQSSWSSLGRTAAKAPLTDVDEFISPACGTTGD